MTFTLNIICRVALFSEKINKSQFVSNSISSLCFYNSKKYGNLIQKKSFSKSLQYMSTKSDYVEPKIKVKKYIKRKKTELPEVDSNFFRVVAYNTAEEYDLESILPNVEKYTIFKSTTFSSDYEKLTDVVHAIKNNESEPKHLFFFREGSVVMWNISEQEEQKIFKFLKKYEINGFQKDLIQSESEEMTYSYSSELGLAEINKDVVMFSKNKDTLLEKFAVSNAMALSVHLGAYEANLEQYIETMEPVTQDLKSGVKIKMSRDEVLRKTGQLFALRHKISLSSDLLDIPDFYWDREELEILYQTTFNYFCINKRTRIVNEKINHCIELVQLLSSHLSDKHHVRLEWMIIVLIMVEVAFEILHYIDRYLDAVKEEPLMTQQ